MSLIKTKGPVRGRCNICGSFDKLCADHIPPKGVNRFDHMQLNQILESLNLAPSHGRYFQRGVKFRSICASCNSDILGSRYDPELVAFANQVRTYLYSTLSRPNTAVFSVRPGLILRSILGHILAIGIERFPRGEVGDQMANFVLDNRARWPSNFGAYYWLYPYSDQVAIRTCGIAVRLNAPILFASVLKFLPFAFMVTWDADSRLNIPHRNLADYMAGDGSAKVDVPIDFHKFPKQRYPEAPGKSGAVYHGEDAFRTVYKYRS